MIDERTKLWYGFLWRAGGRREDMIEICRACVTDLDEIVAIELSGFASPWSGEMYQPEFEREMAVFLAARDEGGLAGYALGWAVAEEGHILKIAAREDRRREGVGGMLLEALGREFIARGVSVEWLEVRQSNTAARSFYHRHGFKLLGLRRGYYSDTGEDAVVLFKDLKESEKESSHG